MKAAVLLNPVFEWMANIWIVAGRYRLCRAPCELSAVENNVGIMKNSRSQWNAVIPHRAARLNLFLCGEIRMGQLGISLPAIGAAGFEYTSLYRAYKTVLESALQT